ncbi:MAG: hypothetical protein ABJA78_15840 [Ferruginibacter sp.]
MKKIIVLLSACIIIFSCNEKKKPDTSVADLNTIAKKYVQLGLLIGQYDGDFVDAYYGPDSLKPVQPKLAAFPNDSLLASVNGLSAELKQIMDATSDDTLRNRANWISQQLIAFGRRIKIFSGEQKPFDEESKELFGVTAPNHDEKYFQELIKELDSLLPGNGTLQEKFQQLSNKFIIPKDKLDTVFKTAIAEARKRTLSHYSLPTEENFTLEYVTNKPWSGYNWYKGNYKSVIQINTDLPILIDRAIDLACHEGYPGHHVYNMLLEKNLYHDKGDVEMCMYPLFSPQSLIAEGSANYGIQVCFPGDEAKIFTKNILLPIAGLDTAGIDFYFRAGAVRTKLNYARNEVARGIINKTMDEAEAIRWLKNYALFSDDGAKKSISFITKYRSYVINYNYGQDMVKNYIESNGGTAANSSKRWELFGKLLSNQVVTGDLLK